MPVVDILWPAFEFNRTRTLALLEQIEQLPEPQAALAWRPGPQRAHIGWQLMHIGITEEIFATERLAPTKLPRHGELWPRFRGGSIPEDIAPTLSEIRQVLSDAREMLGVTLGDYGDERLQEVPPALQARNLNVLAVLHIIAWHEAHHQGQAHLTLNAYRNRPV